jgi:hypothetical protein
MLEYESQGGKTGLLCQVLCKFSLSTKSDDPVGDITALGNESCTLGLSVVDASVITRPMDVPDVQHTL